MSHENVEELWVRDERGEIRQATGEQILSVARGIMNRKVRRGVSMTSPQLVKNFLSIKLGTLEHEVFCVLLLDLCVADGYVDISGNRPRKTTAIGALLNITIGDKHVQLS